MHRRVFLMFTTAGMAAGSGCLAWAGVGGRVQTPEHVESFSFTITEEGGGPVTSPSISFDSEEREVHVVGTMWAGNPCQEAQLKTIDYETQTDELSVLIGVGKKPFAFNCPDSLGADTYEVVITVRSRLPETVTATHRNFQGDTATTTASPSG